MEKGTSEEKDDNKQVLHLVSAVAIAFLLVQHKVFLGDDGLYANLFRSLVPHNDVKKKSCAAFEGLIKHFPKQHWM